MVVHSLFSQDQDTFIEFFDKFDRNLIKKSIIKHLTDNPSDILEHCKDYPKNNYKRYLGVEILNFYGVNPKNKKPSLIITKGNKDFYRALN